MTEVICKRNDCEFNEANICTKEIIKMLKGYGCDDWEERDR